MEDIEVEVLGPGTEVAEWGFDIALGILAAGIVVVGCVSDIEEWIADNRSGATADIEAPSAAQEKVAVVVVEHEGML